MYLPVPCPFIRACIFGRTFDPMAMACSALFIHGDHIDLVLLDLITLMHPDQRSSSVSWALPTYRPSIYTSILYRMPFRSYLYTLPFQRRPLRY